MAKVYCEYCGTSASNINSLTCGSCLRHPNGAHSGKHKLYEGSEKSKYECKYCGTSASSISSLTCGSCLRHPNGTHQGKHSPAV